MLRMIAVAWLAAAGSTCVDVPCALTCPPSCLVFLVSTCCAPFRDGHAQQLAALQQVKVLLTQQRLLPQ
jgi:hypothetical protein